MAHRFALIYICSLWGETGLETKWVTALFVLLVLSFFFFFFLLLISNEQIQSAYENLCDLKAPDLEARLFLRSRINCEPQMYQSVITGIDSDLQTVHCHWPVDFSSLGCRESSHPGCLRPAVQPSPQPPQQRPPSGLLLLLFLLLHLQHQAGGRVGGDSGASLLLTGEVQTWRELFHHGPGGRRPTKPCEPTTDLCRSPHLHGLPTELFALRASAAAAAAPGCGSGGRAVSVGRPGIRSVSSEPQPGRLGLADSVRVVRPPVVHAARGRRGGGELLSTLPGVGAGGAVSAAGERGAPQQAGEHPRCGTERFDYQKSFRAQRFFLYSRMRSLLRLIFNLF